MVWQCLALFNIFQQCWTFFVKQRKKDIPLFSEAAAKLDTLLAVAEKSEVVLLTTKWNLRKKNFWDEIRYQNSSCQVLYQNCGFFPPAIVQLLGWNSAESGDVAVFTCTGFSWRKISYGAHMQSGVGMCQPYFPFRRQNSAETCWSLKLFRDSWQLRYFGLASLTNYFSM